MHYYAWNIGDYVSHTHHLSPMEDLAYRRMLDHYYLHEKPLFGDAATIARTIGLKDHAHDVAAVLEEFFEQTETGYANSRADREIVKYHDRIAASRRGGIASVNSRSSGLQPDFKSTSTIPQPTNNQEPVHSTQEPVQKEKLATARHVRRVMAEKPVEIEQSLWDSYLAVRKDHGKPLTALALATLQRKALKIGISQIEFLQGAVDNNWLNYDPSWERSAGKNGKDRPSGHDFENVDYGEIRPL